LPSISGILDAPREVLMRCFQVASVAFTVMLAASGCGSDDDGGSGGAGGTGGAGGSGASGGSAGSGATGGSGGSGATGGSGGSGATGGSAGAGTGGSAGAGTGGSAGAGTGGSAGGTACNQNQTGDPVCDACLNQNCCPEIQACEANPACVALIGCIQTNCQGAPDITACALQNCTAHIGGAGEAQAIQQCSGASCPNECSL
jgi:hypothetical protein